MRVAAFFDMDHTVITRNSGSQWIRFLRKRRELDLGLLVRSIYWTALYRMSVLDMEAVATRFFARSAGDSEAELIQKTEEFFAAYILPFISQKARERVEWHRQQDHLLVLLTSATPYVANPMAQVLNLTHVICTRPHVKDGRLTGTCDRPTCYGDGKVHHAESFAATQDVDLGSSFFYTDSYSDLPMLTRVGQRRVINPDRRLRQHAAKSGWPIEYWL